MRSLTNGENPLVFIVCSLEHAEKPDVLSLFRSQVLKKTMVLLRVRSKNEKQCSLLSFRSQAHIKRTYR